MDYCKKGCCCVKLDFAMAASQNGVCITQQKCHVMTLFYDCSMLNDESNKKNFCFFAFTKIIGFSIMGKLESIKSNFCDAAVAKSSVFYRPKCNLDVVWGDEKGDCELMCV